VVDLEKEFEVDLPTSNRQKHLASRIYHSLVKKYYWRDWLVAVYHSDRKKFSRVVSCYGGSKTVYRGYLPKIGKKRVNLVIDVSSVPKSRKIRPFSYKPIRDFKPKGRKRRKGWSFIDAPHDPSKILGKMFNKRPCHYRFKAVTKSRPGLFAPSNRKFWTLVRVRKCKRKCFFTCKRYCHTVTFFFFVLG